MDTTEGVEAVKEMVCAASDVFRTLVEGLSKRIDENKRVALRNGGYAEACCGYFDEFNLPLSLEQLQQRTAKLKLENQMEVSDEDEEDEDDDDDEDDADSEAQREEKKKADERIDDADAFSEAFVNYKAAFNRVRGLVEKLETQQQQGGQNGDDNVPEEMLQRVQALRAEATEKNRKIKHLIDRLRYLRHHLSALDCY